jgi:hypothetical protein
MGDGRKAVAAFVVAGALAAGLAYLWRDEPAPPAPRAPEPAPIAVAAVPDAAVAEAPSEPPAEAPAAPPPSVSFQSGFCTKTGDEEFTSRFSLREAVSSGVDPEIVAALSRKAEPETRLDAVRKARRILPRDPALGLELALLTRDTGALDEAIEGLDVYLAADPAPALQRLRARLEVQRDIQKNDQHEERSGITLFWPPKALTAVQADDLLRAVDRNLDDAARFTGTRRRKHLTVVVYSDRSELLAVSCASNWTAALYDGTLRVVATQTPDGFNRQVLRHESMHAQFSPLTPRAPLWFHEGVAEAFAEEGLKYKWKLLLKNRVWVPFSSLDETFSIFDSADAQLAYAQSYAMVEMMRDAGGEQALSVAADAFAEGADTPTVLARACRRKEVTGNDLLDFMQRRLSSPGR